MVVKYFPEKYVSFLTQSDKIYTTEKELLATRNTIALYWFCCVTVC